MLVKLLQALSLTHVPTMWTLQVCVAKRFYPSCSPLERDYHSLCVKQPIGKKLFQLFCRSRPDLQNYISLLDALVISFWIVLKKHGEYAGLGFDHFQRKRHLVV